MSRPPRIACIGECMIELSEHPDGRITRAFGGDTLNTAVYLARLGMSVDYVTALGDDDWSETLLTAWRHEGVGTDRVVRMRGRLPGLYIIQTDAGGERRFSYWRDSAPARDLFTCPQTPDITSSLARDSHIYFSGISLSLYGQAGRETLFAALDIARHSGTRVIFDTNFRARGWPDRDEARAVYAAALRRADLVFASTEDLAGMIITDTMTFLTSTAPCAEIVLKLEHPACRVRLGDAVREVAGHTIANVVDTTAAGDSFAAAYLAARIRGADPEAAARAGHALASVVVQHRGAIIPRAAMPPTT